MFTPFPSAKDFPYEGGMHGGSIKSGNTLPFAEDGESAFEELSMAAR